jgi:transcriptional regulator with XRE-family HTH domain
MDLRELRESRVMTQTEVALKMGIEGSTVARLETGAHKPRPKTIRKLAEALGVSVTKVHQAVIVTKIGRKIPA